MKIKIVEVGPRDGLQNEKKILSLENKLWLIHALVEAGLKRIEAGAFVSPNKVPQMSDSSVLFKKINLIKPYQNPKLGVHFSALVPNLHGLRNARDSGVREIAVFGSCSESFSLKNINCTIAESFVRFREVIKESKKNKMKVRGYLSTAFGCPYEGKVSLKKVISLTDKMLGLGVKEVSIGDTIGVATPKQVRTLLKELIPQIGTQKIALHFHDTRGTALANVLAGLDLGITTYDSSIGGLGGCPYAQGASGNLATEDLVYMLEGMGLKTGVDINKIYSLKDPLEKMIGHVLPGRAIQAGSSHASTQI
ncbi:MAG: hydroxymethylglutaryl-CoA lyase [Bdellovibrionales bacterium]|nr:hydroxymethylglutaryl-CoA lyase [Bdellovibrionales bacterium]